MLLANLIICKMVIQLFLFNTTLFTSFLLLLTFALKFSNYEIVLQGFKCHYKDAEQMDEFDFSKYSRLFTTSVLLPYSNCQSYFLQLRQLSVVDLTKDHKKVDTRNTISVLLFV